MTKKSTNQSGFTIIEVVLVLAIAGLIFLVVFLALPALQRSQRDSQRRSDLGRMLAQLETYASNNNGQYPDNATEVTSLVDNYLINDGAVWEDPTTGTTYSVTIGSPPGTVPEPDGTIWYDTERQCADTEGDFTTVSGNNRSIAAIVGLENGEAYCQDNR